MSNARILANTINASSQIVVPSGGVNFGTSTDGSGTVTGGVLDDYEEGTWTPTIEYQNATDNANATETSQTGYYTKIGRLVQVTFKLTWTQASLSPVNDNVSVYGLPFVGETQTPDTYAPAILETNLTNYIYVAFHPTSGVASSLISAPTLSTWAQGNIGNELGTGTITISGTLMYFTS